MKIAMLGAGGYVFPLRLIGDMLSVPELRESTLTLMDIDQERLASTTDAARALVRHHGFSTSIESTLNQRRAIAGADIVILTFQVGGLDAYRLDVEIPRRYGLDQCVGDTLGPGGVFRFLRTAPVLATIAADIQALAPGALVINYANPMAMNCWYLDRLGVEAVGLCHSVQGTSRMLARQLEVPYPELRYQVAGINHQAWFLTLRRGNEDLYPRLRDVMTARHLAPRSASQAARDTGDHGAADRGDTDYEGGRERVRTEIMRAFGYFHTESSHHASEYVPYFRKNEALIAEAIPQRWDYFELCSRRAEGDPVGELLGRLKADLSPSVEYGASIARALFTGEPAVVYGNVPNRGSIDNLPASSCVEVPCLVDANGVRPVAVGLLPPQCAALNRTNIGVQELAVEAVVASDREHIYQAVALDPLTGALLTLPRIRELVDEMIVAEQPWLPAFTA